MDDIVQARKARLKLWNTSSEKVCEVQTVNEAGASSPKRYTNRRYSDFVGSTLAPIPSNRRASEIVPPASVAASSAGGGSMASNLLKKTGIVVSKTDLMSLMSSLTSSATEINKMEDTPPPLTSFTTKNNTSASTSSSTACSNVLLPEAPGMSRSNRSNSFDVSILHNAKQIITGGSSASDKNAAALSGWFEKRHQPMARKKSMKPAAATVSFSKDVLDRFKDKEEKTTVKEPKKSRNKLRWDNKGSFVDPHIIGNAIEGFLRKSSGGRKSKKSSSSSSASSGGASTSSKASSFWFGKADEDDSKDTCDSSLCSTLKDLFVK